MTSIKLSRNIGGMILTTNTLSKEKIITAALVLINRHESLNITNLGKLVGTRSQAIYNYFDDIMDVKVAVATKFFDELSVRLQADLLGLTGEQALKTFVNVSVQYSLGKFDIVEMIIDIPSEKWQDAELKKSFLQIQVILKQSLVPVIKDEILQLVVCRMLVNLIIGEVICAGRGRIDSNILDTQESFSKMIQIVLRDISEQNK